MSFTKRWLMEVEKQEITRLQEQCIKEKDIIEAREQILKLYSRLDYDTLLRVGNVDLKYELSTRPEELYS